MDKLKLAHEMAMELVKIKPELAAWQIADRCFEYADAMQAEADKRVNKERPEALCGVGGFTGSHIMERPHGF